MKLVIVEWVDSHITPTWTREPASEKALRCKSVGWLVNDGDDAKTLAGSMSVEDAPQRCCQITIPAAAIVKMRTLR